MFEKILQKLKEQRAESSNVSDRSLEDLAKGLVTVITTDAILEVADLSAAIASIDGNINHYTAEAVKKAATETETEAAKKAKELSDKKAAEKVAKESGETPAWATAILEQNKVLSESIATLKADKTTSSRSDSLNKALVDLPDYYTAPIKAAFKNTSFEDDAKFGDYLKGIESNNTLFQQAAKEQGMNTSTPPKVVTVPKETGETPIIGDARKIVQDEKEKLKANS